MRRMKIVREPGKFWLWLCRFAYRRLCRKVGGEDKRPVGIPAQRDPDNPCESYSPRIKYGGDWSDCQGDGHYLCNECCHYSEKARAEREEQYA